MNELFGSTRDVVKERYALRTPSGFVPSYLPGWTRAVCIVQISPAMGASFCQYFITLDAQGEGRGYAGATEYFVYVLHGKCQVRLGNAEHSLHGGSFAFIPAESEFHFHHAEQGTELLLFQKRFQP